jgi:two-component system chemotaxis sensor kinase CheA
VRLEVDGGDVELDREMIEMIRDPLTHMVRNAIDHGIEPWRSGWRTANPLRDPHRLCPSVGQPDPDRGGGRRPRSGRRQARHQGAGGRRHHGGTRRADDVRAKECLDVRSRSVDRAGGDGDFGRGVGMDVVRANIERIGGLIEVESKPGKGVRFTIRVPLTLTIIPALTVSACGQIFAVPRSAIEEILRAAGDSVRLDQLGNAFVATIRGRRMPVVTWPACSDRKTWLPIRVTPIILLKPAGGSVYALAIDGVHDHEELVVRPAAPAVMSAGLYAGTTLAEDGRPVLLLDPSGMAGKAGILSQEVEAEQGAPSSAGSCR